MIINKAPINIPVQDFYGYLSPCVLETDYQPATYEQILVSRSLPSAKKLINRHLFFIDLEAGKTMSNLGTFGVWWRLTP